MDSEPDREGTPQRGCAAFWGPTRPLLGGDTACEAALSYYVPDRVLAVVRCILSCFVLCSMAYFIAIGTLQMLFVTNWSFMVYAVGYVAITATSLLLLFGGRKAAEGLAKVAVPVYFVSATAALYITPVYWGLLAKPPIIFQDAATHGATLLIHLLDTLVLGARYCFRVQYLLLPVAYLLLYLAFMWIRYAVHGRNPDFTWPYNIVDPQKMGAGRLAGIYVGLILWSVVAGIIILLTTRVHRLRDRQRKAEDQSGV